MSWRKSLVEFFKHEAASAAFKYVVQHPVRLLGASGMGVVTMIWAWITGPFGVLAIPLGLLVILMTLAVIAAPELFREWRSRRKKVESPELVTVQRIFEEAAEHIETFPCDGTDQVIAFSWTVAHHIPDLLEKSLRLPHVQDYRECLAANRVNSCINPVDKQKAEATAYLRRRATAITIDDINLDFVNEYNTFCTASGFLDSGLTVFASTPPRPARGGRVAPGPGFGRRTSPASTARCTSA